MPLGGPAVVHVPTLIRKRIELARNARRSRAEIEHRQLVKFRRLVAYAAKYSPYYRKVIDERRIDVATCRPQDFPVLTKVDVAAHFDDIMTDRAVTDAAISEFNAQPGNPFDLFLGKYHVVATSGTSGRKGFFVYSERDWTRGMTQTLRINPPRFERRRLAYFAMITKDRPPTTGGSMVVTARSWPLSLVYDLAMYSVIDPIADVVEALNRFQPTDVTGYPNALAVLAEGQKQGRLRIAPVTVQCSGEPVTAAYKDLIESAFGVPLINTYACSEHLFMGFSRPEFGGMYLLEDDLIFELGADHTLVTNLFNCTMPLIRYQLSDRLVPQPDRTGAYAFTLVADIIGRGEMTAVLTNRHGVDDVLYPDAIMALAAKNVLGFQVEVTSKSSCTMKVCLEANQDERRRASALNELKDGFAAVLARKEITGVRIDAEEVTELTRDPSGKVRVVIPAPVVAPAAA
jgi:phenylacetate-coenzyme A ligase PaaK-like adenylate-forming protein